MISVKLADLADTKQATAIIELLNQYALHPMGGGEALADFTRQNLISTLSKRMDCSIVLAFDDQQAIGLCNCFEGFSSFACKPLMNIHDLYIADGYRNRGIARQMMLFAEEIARQKGCCKMTLEVLSKNEAAKKSYHASGYQPYQLDVNYGSAEFWQKSL